MQNTLKQKHTDHVSRCFLAKSLHTVERHLITHFLDITSFAHLALTCNLMYAECQLPFAAAVRQPILYTAVSLSKSLLSSSLLRHMRWHIIWHVGCLARCQCNKCALFQSGRVSEINIISDSSFMCAVKINDYFSQSYMKSIEIVHLTLNNLCSLPLAFLQFMPRLRVLRITGLHAFHFHLKSVVDLHVSLSHLQLLELETRRNIEVGAQCLPLLDFFINQPSDLISFALPSLSSYDLFTSKPNSLIHLEHLEIKGSARVHASLFAALCTFTQLRSFTSQQEVSISQLSDLFESLVQLPLLQSLNIILRGTTWLPRLDDAETHQLFSQYVPMLTRAHSLTRVTLSNWISYVRNCTIAMHNQQQRPIACFLQMG